jgi:hypothetical protein
MPGSREFKVSIPSARQGRKRTGRMRDPLDPTFCPLTPGHPAEHAADVLHDPVGRPTAAVTSDSVLSTVTSVIIGRIEGPGMLRIDKDQ